MAQWRKVVVSGSTAEFNHVSASGNLVPVTTNLSSLGTSTLNFSDLFLDSGAVVNFNSGDMTLTHASNEVQVDGGDLVVEGTNKIGFGGAPSTDYIQKSTDVKIVAAADVEINAGGGNVKPSANDGSALGVAGTGWSDLFLAEGAVINWDSGDFTATQAGNLLTLTGGNTRVDRLEVDSANDYIDVDTDLKVVANANISLEPSHSVLLGDYRISGSAASTGSFGYLNVYGDGVIGGNLTFGDAATDSVTFSADIDSNLIPNVDDSYDLGSASQAWQDLFIEGDITLTDAGSVKATAGNLTVDSEAATLVLDGHTGVDIDASNSGKVTIDGAGGIDIGVAADVAVDFDAAAFDLDASGALTIDSATSISLGTTADVAWDIDTSTLDIDASGAVTIDTSAGGVSIDAAAASNFSTAAGALLLHGAGGINIGTTADVAFDIDTSTLDIDSSGAITIDGTSTILISGDGGATFSDDTEALVYDGSGNVDFDSVAFDLDASGAVTIDSTSTILISGDGGATFSDDTEAIIYDGSGNLDIDSVALDIDSSGAITIDGTSTVSIDGADDMNFTITSGTAGEDLTIQQIGANDSSIFITAAGTGTDAISIDATAGDMLIAPNLINGKTLTIGPSSATQMVFTPHGTAASEKISLINTAGTADDAIKIDSVAGGLLLAAGNDSLHIDADGTDADALNIDSAGGIDVDASAGLTITSTTMALDPSSTFDLDAAGAVTIDGSAITIGADDSGVAISIGHSTSETTINDNLTVTGNLNVAGTETIVDSNVVNISDNIIQVNTGGAKRKGGLQVIDTDGDQTGSVVWDSDGNYFEVGLSGSEYRLPELSTATELSGNNNRVLISDGARIDASAAITDDGSTVDISNRVDAQASLQVTGSLYVSAGASVAASLASLVSFRNNGTTQLGYLASANTSAVTTGLVGYNASTGNLTISSVIDGGSF